MGDRALGMWPVAQENPLTLVRGSQDAAVLCSDPFLLRCCHLELVPSWQFPCKLFSPDSGGQEGRLWLLAPRAVPGSPEGRCRDPLDGSRGQ